jgi:hypothetical protein
MKRQSILITGFVLLLVLGESFLVAQKPGKGPHKTAGEKVREVLPAGEPVFTEHERVLVRDYFRQHQSGLPPGLAKRDRLPPGLEKQLRERGHLPPGLQKKIQSLPMGLERELGALPAGYRRVLIGGNVVLMNEKTAVIYDIIRNAIP